MKRKSLKDIGPIWALALTVATLILIFFCISFISAIVSGFFEDSRAGAEYMTLVTLLVSGFVSGFVSRKMLGMPISAILTMIGVTLCSALLAAIISKYSLSAFMNELTYLLLSLFGIFTAREKKRRKRRR